MYLMLNTNPLSAPRQEAVTLVSLDLLRKTVDYLKRLPVVPTTRELIREIDAHLSDPGVAAAKREAAAAEVLASRRTGGQYTPSGQPSYLVVVEGSEVTFTCPKFDFPTGYKDNRMEHLEKGVVLVTT